MINHASKFFNKAASAISDALSFNQANFSGCIDIIVIEQDDGQLKSTPWYIRLGKKRILKPNGRSIMLRINGKIANFQMKLTRDGEAYFEEELTRPKSNMQQDQSDLNSIIPENIGSIYNLDEQFAEELLEANSIQNEASLGIMNNQDAKLMSYNNAVDELQKVENIESSNLNTTKISSNLNPTPGIRIDSRVKAKTISESSLCIKKEGSSDKIETKAKNGLANDKQNKNIMLTIEEEKFSRQTRKIIRPTSHMLKSLNLKRGINKLEISITDNWSSKSVQCCIYYWPKDVKIIISDLDGTITKSDILGLIMPSIGKDWIHIGICSLFSNISDHGYKFIYLTARSIGLAKRTRKFLDNLKQGDYKIPSGPVMTSPNRLVESLKREIILKRPDIFKLAFLKDIKNIFPKGYNPFFAGFGNKDTDAVAYRAIGIPMEKIFLINHKSELLKLNDTLLTSYMKLKEIIHHEFPKVDIKSYGIIEDLKERDKTHEDDNNNNNNNNDLLILDYNNQKIQISKTISKEINSVFIDYLIHYIIVYNK